MLRERKQRNQNIAHFDLKSKGHDATLEIPDDLRTPLLFRDLQQLLLQTLFGSGAYIEPLKWCKIDRWSKLIHVNVLAIEGIGLGNLNSEIRSIFPFKLEFISPSTYNSNLADDLSVLPVSARQQKKLQQDFGSLKKACKNGPVFKVFKSLFNVKESGQKMTETPLKMKLMLSLSEMLEENYPLPLKGPMKLEFSHFKFSQDEYEQVSNDSPLFAVDCEMCLTNIGQLELTKICVIDSNLKVIYQSFVKPKNPIVNYLTQFSGVTKEILENVETSLEDVQIALQKLLPKDAIWIGQSLENDLNALKLFHPYVIDTSVIYNISGEPRRKTKLKTLAHMFLGENEFYSIDLYQFGSFSKAIFYSHLPNCRNS